MVVTTSSPLDHQFAGSIPALYETYLVPMLFEPYAADIVGRVRMRAGSTILEIAAGTGVVTRALALALPADTSIVATDLNQAMLDRAAAAGTSRPVEWRQADAMKLPFPDGVFDTVVCQFGAMFFPDKAKAFSEARRVLAPGGAFVFSVWDRLAENDLADIVTTVLESVFPADPPRFMDRTPHDYHDVRIVERDLAGGGFNSPPQVFTIEARSRAASRANRCDRVLPRHAAAKQDRVARQRAPRRGDGRGRGRSHAPVWRRCHRCPDAGARIDRSRGLDAKRRLGAAPIRHILVTVERSCYRSVIAWR